VIELLITAAVAGGLVGLSKLLDRAIRHPPAIKPARTAICDVRPGRPVRIGGRVSEIRDGHFLVQDSTGTMVVRIGAATLDRAGVQSPLSQSALHARDELTIVGTAQPEPDLGNPTMYREIGEQLVMAARPGQPLSITLEEKT
jgi:hypothetical protein